MNIGKQCGGSQAYRAGVRVDFVRMSAALVLGIWMVAAVPIAALLRLDHQFLPLADLYVGRMLGFGGATVVWAAFALTVTVTFTEAAIGYLAVTGLWQRRRLDWALALFLLEFGSLVILSFVQKNMSDTGLWVAEIKATNIRDWTGFVTMLTLAGVIGMLNRAR